MGRHKSKNITKGYGSKGAGNFGGSSGKPKKPPLTHFLCLPLVTGGSRPQLEESLRKFQEDVSRSETKDVLRLDQDTEANPVTVVSNHTDVGGVPLPNQLRTGISADQEDAPVVSAAMEDSSAFSTQEQTTIPEKAIRPIGTLHLTLGVMSLMTEERVEEAIKLLQSLDLGTMLQDVAEGKRGPDSEPKEKKEHGDTKKSQDRSISPPSIQRETHLRPKQHNSSSFHATPQGPLIISLTSLHSMHPPRKTSILYAAPTDPTNRLFALGSALRSIFQEAEFLLPDDRPLKLHATIVNTIYAKSSIRDRARGQASTSTTEAGDRSRGHGPKAKAPIRLNATEVLDKFKEFVWAKNIRVERLAICKMGAKKLQDGKGEVIGEEYEEVASVKFPV